MILAKLTARSIISKHFITMDYKVVNLAEFQMYLLVLVDRHRSFNSFLLGSNFINSCHLKLVFVSVVNNYDFYEVFCV